MKHLYNYIIKISHELNDTFKTESGMEWYGNKDFSKDRLSNRYATVLSKPVIFDGDLIEVGEEVIIDPSIYYHSFHGENDRMQITTNTIDREKGLYSIEPQNIVLYKRNDTWNGYLKNFLGKRVIKNKEQTIQNGIITDVSKKEKTDSYDVVYVNQFLKEQNVKKGDNLIMKPNRGVSVWIDGVEYTWLRNVDVLAKNKIHEN